MKKYPHFGITILIITISSGAMLLFWRMFSGQNIFSLDFIGHYHYIYASAVDHFLNSLNMLPNWWPAYNSGYPIALGLDSFLNPVILLLAKFFPPFLANNLSIFIFFVLNGLSAYIFSRALKLSREASLITAISYAFSGVVIRHTPITMIVAVMPFLPLAFLCCLKILQGKTKWFWPWLLLIVYSVFGGWAEIVMYAFIATGFFAIYLLIKNKNDKKFERRYLVFFLTAIPLAVLILSPWLLPVMHFVSLSSRAGGIDSESAMGMPTTLSHFLHMINPRINVFYGELLPIIPLKSFDYFLYFGILPLVLVLTTMFIKNKKEKGYLVFFMFLATGAILMTLDNSPLFWFFHQLPILKWFQGPWKWSFIITFSLAILAGYGFDNIKDFFKHRFSKKIIISMWMLLTVALLASASLAIFDKNIKTKITSYGVDNYKSTENRAFNQNDDYYKRVIEKMSGTLVDSFSLKNKWVIIMSLLWVMTIGVITAGKFNLLSEQKWKIFAISVAFLGSTIPWLGLPNGPPVAFLKEPPETAKYMHSVNAYSSEKLPIDKVGAKTLIPYRIFLYTPDRYVAEISNKYKIFFSEDEYHLPIKRELMDNNIHKAFNFDTFKNHQTLAPQRLDDVYYLTRAQEQFTQKSYQDTALFNAYLENFSRKQNLELLGMANIKYILTLLELPNELKPVFTTYVTEKKIPVHVYENPYFMPRWYFANEIKWTEHENEIALEDLKQIKDFTEITLLEKLSLNDEALVVKPNKNDSFEVELYTAGKLRTRTKTKNYRFLVFSESRQPFWQVFINGKEAPLYTANYLFQAVLVPPGENMVEFRYPDLWQQSLISAQVYIKAATNKITNGGTADK